MMFVCLAVALHDVDGPILCQDGPKIRLAGIGATELDGSCRPNQPCVPGDPFDQRRRMATAAIGASIAREDRRLQGHVWFARPVALRCESDGTMSYQRVVARCTNGAGHDLACEAIRLGVALRWARYDRLGRLEDCGR